MINLELIYSCNSFTFGIVFVCASADYFLPGVIELTIGPAGSRFVNMLIFEDDFVEEDENITLTVAMASNPSINVVARAVTITIVDDDRKFVNNECIVYLKLRYSYCIMTST